LELKKASKANQNRTSRQTCSTRTEETMRYLGLDVTGRVREGGFHEVPMRIVTWNCYRGEARKRASELLRLDFDVAVLQECGRPEHEGSDCVWFGERDIQGVGVVTRGEYRVERGVASEALPHSIFPFHISGPRSFNLLGVWAQRKPTYVRAVMQGLELYSHLLDGPAVVIGDFNSNAIWNDQSPSANHDDIVRALAQRGLESAYHTHLSEPHGKEAFATHYWQWKREQPFHLDYCFIPVIWRSELRSVSVGGYQDWENSSDHRPVVVDLASDEERARAAAELGRRYS
jgi:hypothetical protein